MAQVRTQLGAELGLTELFAQPSLSAVAQAIVRGQGSALPAITVADRSGPLPLSFAQQRLWFLAQMEGGSEAYHIPVGLRLKGELDEDVDRIVARHEALRTRFVTEEGQAVQRVASADVGFALDRVDLQGQADREQALATLSEREANTPFDLAHGPLTPGEAGRAGTRAADHDAPHRVGWLVAGRAGARTGHAVRGVPCCRPCRSNTRTTQSGSAAGWRAGNCKGRARTGNKRWTLLSLPTDRARPPQQDYAGGSVEVVFDAELSTGLRTLSQRHGTTLFMTVLAGWSALLSRLSGRGGGGLAGGEPHAQ